jgi:hypothetical protein
MRAKERVWLAELEAGFTVEMAKVEAMKARLLARLREHFQRRERLRLVLGCELHRVTTQTPDCALTGLCEPLTSAAP